MGAPPWKKQRRNEKQPKQTVSLKQEAVCGRADHTKYTMRLSANMARCYACDRNFMVTPSAGTRKAFMATTILHSLEWKKMNVGGSSTAALAAPSSSEDEDYDDDVEFVGDEVDDPGLTSNP
jgi:hypothetical protein